MAKEHKNQKTLIKNFFYLMNAYFTRVSKEVYSNVFSCVASRINFGALLAFSASIHLDTQRHHVSPAFNPGN